jgi:hypothetical protein
VEFFLFNAFRHCPFHRRMRRKMIGARAKPTEISGLNRPLEVLVTKLEVAHVLFPFLTAQATLILNEIRL